MKKLKQFIIIVSILIMIYPVVIFDYKLSIIINFLLLGIVPYFIFNLLPKKKSIVLIILVILFGIVYFLINYTFLLRFVLCGYGSKKYYYENIKNKNIKLVGRSYSCFGTSDDLVLYKEYTLFYFIKMETAYKTFPDYKNIKVNSSEWKEINDN